MEFILNQHIEKLESLKGQLSYTNKALDSDIEPWERREYLQIRDMYIIEIKELEDHIELCKNL